MVQARVTDDKLSNQRAGQIIKPLSESAFFKSKMKLAALAAKEIPDGGGISLHNGLGEQLAFKIEYDCRNGCQMNIKSDILDVSHRRSFLR
jgi:hypothetical protein